MPLSDLWPSVGIMQALGSTNVPTVASGIFSLSICWVETYCFQFKIVNHIGFPCKVRTYIELVQQRPGSHWRRREELDCNGRAAAVERHAAATATVCHVGRGRYDSIAKVKSRTNPAGSTVAPLKAKLVDNKRGNSLGGLRHGSFWCVPSLPSLAYSKSDTLSQNRSKIAVLIN